MIETSNQTLVTNRLIKEWNLLVTANSFQLILYVWIPAIKAWNKPNMNFPFIYNSNNKQFIVKLVKWQERTEILHIQNISQDPKH